jgi:hypothetical protein
MRNHYTLENLLRAVRNPRLFLREGHRVFSLPVHHLYDRYVDRTLSDDGNVMEEDWDTLVLLDACRYDYFEEHNWLDGELESRIVGGNMSWEFMENNFVGGEFHDTVYVTANPYATRLADGTFHYTDYLIDEWDDDVGTIFPEDVRKAALDAAEEYPNKRLIVHFMQPHRPYLGPTADELRERVNLKGYRNEGDGLQIWGAVKEKKVTPAEVRRAYGESLDIVLEEVESLVESLGGKTVVTADHGEMLGERVTPLTTNVWGHSEGFSTRLLRTVPWLTIEGEERRSITAGGSAESADLDEDEVSERLEALGYTE